MRILLVAPGRTIHTQRFISMFLNKGHEVILVDRTNPLPNESGISYQFNQLNDIRGIHRFGEVRAMRAQAWLRIAQMRMIFQRVKPDVVNVHWVDDRAWSCARAGLRPLVLSCWGSDINHFFVPLSSDSHHLDPLLNKNEGKRRRIASALRSANWVTADSQEVLERCEKLSGRNLKSSIWYFGVDINRFRADYDEEAQAQRQQLHIPSTSKVILSCRRLYPFLGQYHILQAFAELSKDPHVPDAVLVFRRYLALPEFEADLETQAKKLGISQKIHWLERSSYDEVPIHYAMSDLIVNYPERDAFPVSLLEAAACKRPVVSSNLPAYQGAFTGSFMLVPPNEPEALAKALKAALTEEPAQTNQRIEQAYAAVQRVGSLQRSLEMMTNVFEGVRVDRKTQFQAR